MHERIGAAPSDSCPARPSASALKSAGRVSPSEPRPPICSSRRRFSLGSFVMVRPTLVDRARPWGWVLIAVPGSGCTRTVLVVFAGYRPWDRNCLTNFGEYSLHAGRARGEAAPGGDASDWQAICVTTKEVVVDNVRFPVCWL